MNVAWVHKRAKSLNLYTNANPLNSNFLFMIVSSTQTIILSYLTVVLSTIEKEFGLQSKEAAWVYSGNEIAQVLFIVFLPFVGKAKRRPLYIGIGACVSAIGMLLIALPHFVGRGKEYQKGSQ